METTLAILMVLGIFVGIPAVIGFAIASFFVLADRRVRRAERANGLEEAEALLEQPAEAHSKAMGKKPAKVA
ncbi:hypothetical protein ACFLYG_02065 [Chloroflexota bacterium]